MSQDRYVNKEEIAFLLDVETRTITNYIKRHAEFPSRVSGNNRTFPVKRCLQWQRDRLIADAVADMAQPAPTNIIDAESRKAIADAELAELKLARLRGDVVAVQAAAKEVRDAFTRVRARLLSTPGEYGSQILHIDQMPRAVFVLRQLVDTVLAELQANAGRTSDDEASDDTGETGDALGEVA
jgi:phage terminase Nu1 subunit (DNA packaging protein)